MIEDAQALRWLECGRSGFHAVNDFSQLLLLQRGCGARMRFGELAGQRLRMVNRQVRIVLEHLFATDFATLGICRLITPDRKRAGRCWCCGWLCWCCGCGWHSGFVIERWIEA